MTSYFFMAFRSAWGKQALKTSRAVFTTSGQSSFILAFSHFFSPSEIRLIGKLINRFISIAAAFSAVLKREQALQIWAAWPFPENFSFALYSPHILQQCPCGRFFFFDIADSSVPAPIIQ